MTLQGKGMYIWKLHRIAGGNVQAMVDKAKAAGLTHVIIKIADGSSAYNVDLAGPAADAFKAAGLQVWGFAWLDEGAVPGSRDRGSSFSDPGPGRLCHQR